MRGLRKPGFSMLLLAVLFFIGLSVSPYDESAAPEEEPLSEVLSAIEAQETIFAEAISTDSRFRNAVLILEAPKTLHAGESLHVFAILKRAKDGEICEINWYLNDAYITGETITTGEPPEFRYEIANSTDMPESIDIKAEIIYTTPQGDIETLIAGSTIAITD